MSQLSRFEALPQTNFETEQRPPRRIQIGQAVKVGEASNSKPQISSSFSDGYVLNYRWNQNEGFWEYLVRFHSLKDRGRSDENDTHETEWIPEHGLTVIPPNPPVKDSSGAFS